MVKPPPPLGFEPFIAASLMIFGIGDSTPSITTKEFEEESFFLITRLVDDMTAIALLPPGFVVP